MNILELKPGCSSEGEKIPCFKTEGKFPKYTYLMAGVHGDEVEGVYILEQLFMWLKEHDELNPPLLIIPVLNVDGHRHGTR